MKKIMNSPFFALISRDLSVRYLGSYMGILWAFVQPVVTLVIFYVVFSMGFKVEPVQEVPFMVWLIPGYIGWQYFGESVSGGAIAIVESSYLVKKIAFKVERLPVVKMMSALVVHLFFVVIMMVYIARELGLGLRNMQLVYYMVAMMSLVYGISLVTSALSVYVRDVVQVVGMALQLGFWGTPIFWSKGMLPAEYQWLVEVNPMAYIVEGYRQSMIGGEWFWERPETVYYWVLTVTVIMIGRRVFRRMRPGFADVL